MFSETRHDTLFENLQRFTLENRWDRQLPQPWQRFRTSHACTGRTLRQRTGARNRKLAVNCAETVEPPNILVDGGGKRGKNRQRERNSPAFFTSQRNNFHKSR